MNFDWDPKKAEKNLKNHKVSFEDATEVFEDPGALDFIDEQHSSA